MVSDLLQRVDAKKLLPEAFRKCGLAPLNREEVLQRIPSSLTSQQIARHLDQQLVEKLEVRRFGDVPKRKGRGPKIAPGKSYSALEEEEDSPEEEEDSPEEEEDSPEEEEDSPEEEEGGGDEVHAQAGGSGVRRIKSRTGGVQYQEEDDKDDEEEEEESDEELPDPELRPPTEKIPGTMVVAVYEGEWFIAEVMEDQRGVPGGYTRLKFMAIKGTNVFTWPNKDDRVITYNDDILLENIDPIPLNSRGHFGINEKDLKRVQSWMVVVYCPLIQSSFLFYFKIFNNFTIKV
jgi:hypothetical protein